MENAIFTHNLVKAELYSQEPLYGQAVMEFTAGRESNEIRKIENSALLMIKPDGLNAGKGRSILDFVLSRGFGVLHWEKINLDFLKWHSLWRYQLTSATVDRLAVNQLLLDGPALLILLQGEVIAGLPASVQLSSLKGPSDVTKQTPDCLRYILKQPNRILSYLHVADEPADILREITILADPFARSSFWNAILHGEHVAPDALYAEITSHPIKHTDIDLALKRTIRAVKRAAGDLDAKAYALSELDKMSAGQIVEWRPFELSLRKANAICAQWDLALIGSARIIYDRPDGTKQIPPGSAGIWKAKLT